MQCIGWLGVERIVQTGKVFGVGFGVQSKHSVTSYAKDSRKRATKLIKAMRQFEQRTLNRGCTWPRYPAVPDSTSGMFAAIHILFTCLRASTNVYQETENREGNVPGFEIEKWSVPRLSRAFKTMSNCLNHWISYLGSLIFPCIGNILTLGLKAVAVWAATCLNARDINDHRRMWSTGNRPHHSFTLLHVLFLEQELTIEIGNVNGVQIKQCNLAETRKNDVFHYRRSEQDIILP